MAQLAFSFSAPALPDLSDPVDYTLGVQFELSVPLSCIGVQWRVPNTAPTGNSVVTVWGVAGETNLASKTVSYTGQGGQTVTTLFDTPVSLSASTTYMASVLTHERYVATTNDTWPKSAGGGILTATADNGWLAEDLLGTGSPIFPDTQSGNDANFHVSPVLLTADGSTVSIGRRRYMTTYVRGTQGRLNDIMTVLGTTTSALWPFSEFAGSLVAGIAPTDFTSAETAGAAEALEDDFSPQQLPCGLFSYHFHPTGDHHLAGSDHANYSFGNGTVDGPFSVGAWIRPNAIATNVIMAKYDSAGNKEEWRLFIDSNGLLSLELHDASASATEIAVSSSAMTIGKWIFVAASYDGGETSPVVNLYVDGALVNDGATTESGSYVAMENTDAPLTIGCSGVTATPVAEFHGRIALPFLTGKALSGSEVSTLYSYMAPMVGAI